VGGKCVKNCEVSEGGGCGGMNHDSAKVEYDNVQTCCRVELKDKCHELDTPCTACTDVDISSYTTPTLYWIDWTLGGKCVQNCNPSNGIHCRGDIPSWEVAYTDLSKCCQNYCWNQASPCEGCTYVPY